MSPSTSPAPRGVSHAPRTSRLKKVLGPLYFTGVFWYRFHLFGVRVLPEWIKGSFVAAFAFFFFLALGNVRRALAANHELVYGPSGWWTRMRRVLRTIYTFSWCLTERYEQFVPHRAATVRVENPELWRESAETSSGVLLVTSHIGGWELGSVGPTKGRKEGLVHIVREAELDASSQRFVRGLMERLGGARYVTHFAGDDLSLGPTLLEALRRGDTVALQTDRPRSAGKVERVRMLGTEVELPLGPAVLARAAGVPMLPVFTFREGRGRYRIVFRERVHVKQTADRDRDLHDAVQEVARSIEWAIREVPEQWFCFADLRALKPAAARADVRPAQQQTTRPVGA